MKIGLVYPQTEFGDDPVKIRDYAQTAEGLGYSHILAYDHVLGANPDRPGGLNGPYTFETPFHEPFVLFAFMAAVTESIGFTTGIIILPQRQTALVAKQAATLDRLSGGRLRLGIGIGWNEVEYIALNANFNNRGRRSEEQIEVLRRLWTEELVTYTGQWHSIPDAGINPLPVQRPIPIWLGGSADQVVQRVAKMGDGWLLNFRTAELASPSLDTLAQYLEEAGRPSSEVGIEARLHYGEGDADQWQKRMEEWKSVGITHFTLNTMRSDLRSAADHLDAIQTFAATVELG